MNKIKFNKQYQYKVKEKNINESNIIKNAYIKQKRKIEERIEAMYKYDVLTGLANSVYFFEKLNDKLEKTKVDNKKGAVIYIDIDNYKTINNNWGYCLGDQILQLFARLINNCIGKHAELTRLNGDEFVILVNEFDNIIQVEKICNNIYENLKKPFKILEDKIYLTVSMGISIFPDNSIDAEELLKFCDFAMYKSKHNGKGTYTVFNNKALELYYREVLIKNELKNAIDKSELDIFYQPQINALSNKIIGMEALIRWNNNKLGSVSPSEFIPIAENTGDIVKIGDWIVDEVLKQTSIWKKRNYKFNTISLNISPIQMKRIDFKNKLLDSCTKYKIPPHLLEIEITEGTLIDVCEEKMEVLNELIDNGINIAIDDFGTGYSSLSYLINIPINTLKIDKTFVDNIENYKNKVLIKSIVDLSKDLKYKIITEGVETKKQKNILTDLGCNIIQGFYFSKPLTKDKMENLLKSNSK
ncbi:phytochrome-like protein cph2 [Clostridium puniceum]|uniref:Phytochrome-like protein cph2 n=1 Tax=Clostridium puniceum TaxID=29367 RepID=A0A1S8TXR6_9CLOT|nr:EAL domain-containing protein [Clostridium puniceum]OOM82541.1 phytochrome-like protein cph2 [Clostridium puniceum]